MIPAKPGHRVLLLPPERKIFNRYKRYCFVREPTLGSYCGIQAALQVVARLFYKITREKFCYFNLCSTFALPSHNDGGLAQLVERLHGMQEVTGSTPVFSTSFKSPQGDFLR